MTQHTASPKKRKSSRPVWGSRTYATMNKTVIIKRIDPDTGEEIIVSLETAPRRTPKPSLRLDKDLPD